MTDPNFISPEAVALALRAKGLHPDTDATDITPENVARTLRAMGAHEEARAVEALAAERDRAIQDAIENAQYVDLVSKYRAERNALAARLAEVKANLRAAKETIDEHFTAKEAAEAREAKLRDLLDRAVNGIWRTTDLDDARALIHETKT